MDWKGSVGSTERSTGDGVPSFYLPHTTKENAMDLNLKEMTAEELRKYMTVLREIADRIEETMPRRGGNPEYN